MPSGSIFMTPGVLRDLKTEATYDIPADLRVHPVGSLVTYTLAAPRTVGSITRGLAGMTIANSAVDDEAGRLIPLSAALRGAYPERTRVRFYGTPDEVSGVDALGPVIGTPARRVDVVDLTESAPADLSDLGVSIEQDAEDKSDFPRNQLYYHVGPETAWTTRIHTCTALAMWSRTAGISYLSHADSNTPSKRIADHMTEFFTDVLKAGAVLSTPGELSIVLFTAEDTLVGRATSVQSVLGALNHLGATHTRAFYDHARCHIAGPDDAVVVSAGAAPRVLLCYADHMERLLYLYTFRGERNVRDLLVEVLKSAEPNREFESKAYPAAKKARSQGDEQLYRLLVALVGLTEEDAAEQWG
ncbi:hypothetical protein ACFQ08_06340 [Streptosporangium algeriense]|uniref:Uncharacterized protein n=1 Tax=Streptosporangium algeriense TaxID=1682748 RepID=A0ABW3DNC8_9ACTN